MLTGLNGFPSRLARLARLATWKGLLKSGSANGLLSKSDMAVASLEAVHCAEEPPGSAGKVRVCTVTASLRCLAVFPRLRLMETPSVSKLASSRGKDGRRGEDAWRAASATSPLQHRGEHDVTTGTRPGMWFVIIFNSSIHGTCGDLEMITQHRFRY